MNSKQILDAMTNIDSAYIASAQRRLGYLNGENAAVHLPRRSLRLAAAIAAVVMVLLAASFTTAMAVSEEFRAMIFDIIRVDEEEIIPQQPSNPESKGETETSGDSMYVEQTGVSIGGIIEGTYVHTPKASHARSSIFSICTDEVMMKSGNHYDAYVEDNGQLIQLEEYTFCQDYTILGNAFHVEFQWVEHNGYFSYTYVAPEALYRTWNLAGPVEATLFRFECGITLEDGTVTNTSYPVLINLRTGELTDILAGTGAEKLPGIEQAAISEDRSKMLLACYDKSLYYVDITAKKLYSLDELSGECTEECSLIGDTLTCWSYGEYPNWKGRRMVKVWAFDLNTLERREIYEGKVNFIQGFDRSSNWGNMYCGTHFAVRVDEDQLLHVIDLTTGEESVLEGFVWTEDVKWGSASADGEKLLITVRADQPYYDMIGVLDFGNKTYVRFSRENLTGRFEQTIYWFDNHSIIIGTYNMELPDQDYYVYRLPD